jgi:tetratricopeptide (TPR) repeat protein
VIRAREQLSRGALAAAGYSLSRAHALEPGAAVLRLQAQAFTAGGRADKAERALRRALRLSPKDAGLRADIAGLMRARVVSQEVPNTRGRLRRARRAWEAVARMDPKDGSAHLAISLILRWTEPDAERAALRRAAARDLDPADRFKALMRLGRCEDAVRVAEKILDKGLTLAGFRAFSDPWEKDNRPDREAPLPDVRGLKTPPWREFYLSGRAPAGRRYRWMHYNAAMDALFSCRFRDAVRSFNIALRAPMDWRAHGYLAEAYACVDEPAKARAEMERGLEAAPENERAQVYAWWGELELWLGGYRRSLELTTKACAMGAPFAHGWKGAAMLKLGRREAALAQLESALKLYPKDAEAILWRAEAKRELGRPREALKDLESVAPEHMVWVLFNRALAKRDLGDEPGMNADFERLPAAVKRRVRRGTIAESLEAGLALGRGFRRAEYEQAVWLSRKHG